ncbi:c-type cytochrome [Roseovarius sp. 217]|uniref:c-type cytochrome n=1 Tax=Roseovarius sp. (strain 217) TaxID=314264 RepID=UPI0003247522|nr:cytochrome c [Roseovarius sp. 217]
MNRRLMSGVAGLSALLVAGWAVFIREPAQIATAPEEIGEALVAVTLPANFTDTEQIGAQAFEAKCAACHGVNAAGRDGMGPPLVHVIYEPNHHGDQAFHLAVMNGVRSHHWPFRNMPAVEGLTTSDVDAIVAYVRALQRANGIN